MIENTGSTVKGPAGTATELRGPFKASAQVSLWFVHSPGDHPFWDSFMISIVHLRPLDENDKPHLEFPEAGYELVVAALDPSKSPRPNDTDTWEILHPINVKEQFTATDDAAVEKIGINLAVRAVNGQLILEPQGIRGAREMWHDAVQKVTGKLK